MECTHCGSFVSAKNFKRHTLTNKTCLSLQSGQKTGNVCMFCSKSFGRKDNMQRHEEECSGRLKWYMNRNIELEKEIVKISAERDVYKERCSALEKKSTTTINNITNIKLEQVNIATIEPFTTDTIRKKLAEFTFEVFSKGYLGIVDFAQSIIMKEDEKNYVVTDPSRNAFHRLIETRDWKKDQNGMFLDVLLNELRPVIYKYYDQVLDIAGEAKTDKDRDRADCLVSKTKPVYFGARGDRGSKDREEIRQRLRNDIKKIVTI